ncbi:MAG TPA: acetyl-CoA carboxylase biotin carboxyl carrier protein subunit [Clostridiales bacterium]|jgi:biotin carboxyl carrier protein|nr:acetyl-CoA carboxylase biotin carboxyl carrier protein subunit [Clostridiales bacterium]
MKKYNITVNGKTYEVEVEEINGGGQTQSAPAPKPQATQSAPTPAKKAQPSQPAPSAGAGDVTAPMPGTVLEVKVEEGQSVKAGDVVLILEAMKMENEITADTDGKVTKIYAPKGSSVNTGDPLVGLE